MEEKLQALKSSSLFETFDDNVLRRFAESCSVSRFKGGDIIFVETSEGDEIYLIADGEVSIRIALANADQDYEIIKEQRGDLLGEMRFIDSLPRSATAIAETDTELLVWRSSSWREICEEDPGVGYRLTLAIAKTLADRLRRWNVRLLDTVDWGIA
ncbi:MAG: cyclic nucleotide-binding domain-containing protein [Pseudomonadota bacterium]|nr:cyclic nucleotide-binding domain-containing protein [Pseudomonadota bacterium]